jgi:hypothetical protein
MEDIALSALPLEVESESESDEDSKGTLGTTHSDLHAPNDHAPSSNLYHISPLPQGNGVSIAGTYLEPENNDIERLDPAFSVRSKSFFYEGRIFAVITTTTTEAGNAIANPTDYNTSHSIHSVRWKERYVYSQLRRYVVVGQGKDFCVACPIYTYGGRGTTKAGVRPEEHGVAYSYGQQAQLLPGETGITKASIQIVVATGVPDLHQASRICYGTHHGFRHNVKVKDIGYVVPQQIPDLISNWKQENN